MAIPATCIWEINPSGSSTNGGAFSRAGTMFTTGAVTSGTSNTSTPNFSDSNYAFVSTDIGAWLYMKSGTNVIPGWYKISSISGSGAGNTAILSAAIGAAVTDSNTASNPPTPIQPSTVLGCNSSTGALSAITWAIDYSQQTGAQVSVNDGTTASSTTLTSATAGFTKAMVGNSIYITSNGSTVGTIATQIRTIATYVSATQITVDTAIATSATLVTFTIGGAQLWDNGTTSIFTYAVSSNTTFLKANGIHTMAVAATLPTGTGNGVYGTVYGYTSLRGDNGQATVQFGSGTTGLTITANSLYTHIRNIIVDAQLAATSTCLTSALIIGIVDNCIFKNFTAYGISGEGTFRRCVVTGGSSAATSAVKTNGASFLDCCQVYGNSCVGITINATTAMSRCLIYNNTGTTSIHGVSISLVTGCLIVNCTIDGNGGDGVHIGSSGMDVLSIQSSIISNNGGYGLNSVTATYDNVSNYNAYYKNSSGSYNKLVAGSNDIIINSATYGQPYVNQSTGNFALNNLENSSGSGGFLRASGYPGVMPGAISQGYLDIGAIQHQDSPALLYLAGVEGGLIA